MDILHICIITSGRIFERVMGGEEKYTISLCNWLLRHNTDVTIIGSTFMNVKSEQLSQYDTNKIKEKDNPVQKKIKVIYPPYAVYILSRSILSFLWIFEIIRIHRKNRINLIHAQDTGFAGLASVVAGKILGIPVITTSHGIRHKTIESNLHGRFKKLFYNIEYAIDIFTIKYSKKVLVVNQNIEKYYKSLINKEIEFLPIPINIKKFEYNDLKRNAIRQELHFSDSSKVICFIGRLSPEKNVLTLIKAFIYASKKDSSIILLIVGEGKLSKDLKQYISDKDSSRIKFCGSRFDIDKVLCGCDIFVLPSFIEGMSTSLLEAMVCERAIICSDIPANRHLLSDDDCIFVNPNNEEDLKSAILRCVEDEKFRNTLGRKAKMKSLVYDEDKIFSKLKTMYYNNIKK